MNPKVFCLVASIFAAAPCVAAAQSDPARMPAIAHVDPRFQSYNVEMVEIIGGRFWKPYDSTTSVVRPSSNGAAAGLDPSLFQQRKPADLYNPRLRKLAAALGPAYVRVSGTWANNVYFQDSDAPAPAQPPAGFGGTLTRAEWKGVIDFAHAVDAKLVTSFSVSAGTRNADGVWTTTQAQRFVDATHQMGGSIAATEFINEPSFPSAAGLPASYNGEAFARDFAVFKQFLRKDSPDTILLGPGSVGEGPKGIPIKLLSSAEILQALPRNSFDAFSYHFYGTVSSRCASSMGQGMGTTPDAALSEEWLSRTRDVFAFYKALRDKYDPGAPIWVTETGQTACGGDRWASTFLDSFRYLDQLGSLAQRNVQVIIHNTLAASDYALIDERTLTPRPNYWAALLWHRTMGTTVLDPGLAPGTAPGAGVHLYAQCTAHHPGSVTLLALNFDRANTASLHLAQASQRYTLTSQQLQGHDVMLNGQVLSLTPDGDLPEIKSAQQTAGDLSLPAASITFLVLPSAGNPACTR